jgi:cytochrome b6-f complex iron-sulfur subunit
MTTADSHDPGTIDRRQMLATGGLISTTAMAGGLAASYGTFVYFAGRYLYPSQETNAWMFVAAADDIAPGGALLFQSPTGISVVITRKVGRNSADFASVDQFLALSSVCPHLGCRVHWEPQNDRFFCPCHLGAFDPEGNPTAGPPLADNQSLPTYLLEIDGGLLYINLPVKPIDPTTDRVAGNESATTAPNGPRGLA